MLVLLWTALFGCEPDPNAPQCLEAERIQVFFDADKDGFGIPGTQRSICPTETGAPEGFSTNDDDCNDAVAAINPGALEECDGRDNDCDDQSDEGLRVVLFYLDSDADGFGSPDLSLTIESCAPPVGYVENRQDCDDSDAGINPQALEICDNRDNDCNLLIDDDDPFRDVASAPRWFPDVDRDGYGTDDDSLVTIQCVPPNNIATQIQGDCNDERADISPDAQETCNRIDDDCDNLIDDSDPDIPVEELVRYWADDDLDGFGDPAVSTLTCFQPWFFVDNDLDCDDDEPLLTDESSGLWWFDNDNDRFGAGMIEGPSCTSPGPGYELVAKGEDCNDAEPFDNPDATERCDPGTPADNDCDGLVDTQDDSLDLSTTTEFWEDDDEDGFGNPLVSTQACTRPLGFTDNFDDCNDADKEIFPDANEVCDTIDNDCDDLIDDAD
ncbi:MAG: putative metal-binding motif-containing protein, partial [Myxococcota bacterium]